MARSDRVTVNFYTSLDTRVTVDASPHDTVAFLKRRFVTVHELCYPEFGQIKLEALLIYWEGKDYHLPETMPVSIVLEMMKEYRVLTALAANQLQPPTEINTSLNASFEDTTTLRPTQSRKIGEEKFQGNAHEKVQVYTALWLPVELDAIPLAILPPDDEPMETDHEDFAMVVSAGDHNFTP